MEQSYINDDSRSNSSSSSRSSDSSSSSQVQDYLMAVAQEDIKVCNTCGQLCFYVSLAQKHECHSTKRSCKGGPRTKSVIRKKLLVSKKRSEANTPSGKTLEQDGSRVNQTVARVCQSDQQRTPDKPVLNRTSVSEEVRVTCGYCDRKFAPNRVVKHREICQRLADTENKPAKPKSKAKTKTVKKQVVTSDEPEKKLDWRRKHDEFINAIRAAQVMKAHLASGGKLSDLPPPPPSDTSDYVTCPHCDRKFNKSAAERHIPFCETQHRREANKKPVGEAAKKKPRQKLVASTKSIKKR